MSAAKLLVRLDPLTASLMHEANRELLRDALTRALEAIDDDRNLIHALNAIESARATVRHMTGDK